MRDNTLTQAEANAVYDILVEHAGASDADEYDRLDFVYAQTRTFQSEWRFMGSLGFGGKFWRNSMMRSGEWVPDAWYVTMYPEDATPERKAAVEATNTALADLQGVHF